MKRSIFLIVFCMLLPLLFSAVTCLDPHKEMVYDIAENPVTQIDLADYDMVFVLTPDQAIPAAEIQALWDYTEGGGILVVSHDDYPPEFNKQHANDVTNHFGINFVDDHLYKNYLLNWDPITFPHQLTNNMVQTKGSTCGRLNVGAPLVGWTTTTLAKINNIDLIWGAISEDGGGTGKIIVYADEYTWADWGWDWTSNEQFLDNILGLVPAQVKNGLLVENAYAEWNYCLSNRFNEFRIKFGGTRGLDDVTFNGPNTNNNHPPPPDSLGWHFNCCCPSTYSNTSNDWISNVTFHTINNTTGQEGSDSHGDYTSLTTTLIPGQTYELCVSVYISDASTQHFWAFINWDQDGAWDIGEKYDLGEVTGQVGGSTETLCLNITVPDNLATCDRCLRVVEQYNSDPEPCDPHPTDRGETEDYMVHIEPLPGYEGIEGFEDTFPPDNWTVIDNDTDFVTWEQGSNPHTGSQNAFLGELNPIVDDWLITPCSCISDYPGLYTTFSFYANVIAGASVDFEVLINIQDDYPCDPPSTGDTWITIDTQTNFSNATYQYFQYDLLPWADNSAYLAIRCIGQTGGTFNVDDVTYPECQNVPCPVTLTNFTAAIMQGEYASLTWSCESESDMLGYMVYRSETSLENADFISQVIAAENLSYLHEYSYEDHEIEYEKTYNYWLEGISFDGITETWGPVTLTIEQEDPDELPEKTILIGNYPNPFKPVTNIKFNIRKESRAILTIVNTKGQVVERVEFEQGYHNYEWNAGTNSSGVYFYKLESENYNETKKMILLK